MPPLLRALLSHPELLIIALGVLIPIIKTMAKKAAIARAEKTFADQSAAAENDRIRTGDLPSLEGPAQAPPVVDVGGRASAKAELEAMAARRRAELARVRAQRAQAGPSPRAAEPMAMPRSQPEPPAEARPKRSKRQARAEVRGEPGEASVLRRDVVRVPVEAAPVLAAAAEPIPARKAAGTTPAAEPVRNADWRRAVVLSEVLSTPVGLRP